MLCLGTGVFALMLGSSFFHLVEEGREWGRRQGVSYPYLKMAFYASWFGFGIGFMTPPLLGQEVPINERWPLGLYLSLILFVFGAMGVRLGREARG